MADFQHGTILPTHPDAGGKANHTIEADSSVVDEAARLAIVQTPTDRGRVIRQTAGVTPGWYIAEGVTGQWQLIGSGGGTDPDAVHVNVAAEISGVAVKGTPTGADFLLIEDAADSDAKKHTLISSLPKPTAAEVTYDNTDSGLTAVEVKSALDEVALSLPAGAQFTVVGGATGELWSSPSALAGSWTDHTAQLPAQFLDVALFGKNTHVAAGLNNTIVYSLNGKAWQTATAPGGAGAYRYGVYSEFHGKFYLVGDTLNSLHSSVDGINWVDVGTTSGLIGEAIAVHPTTGVMVTVSAQFLLGGPGLGYSLDGGVTWVVEDSGPGLNYEGIVWAGTQFVVVKNIGVTGVARSSDGRNWVAQDNADSGAVAGPDVRHAVAYMSNTGRLVAVGEDEGANYTSIDISDDDGVTWAPAAPPVGYTDTYRSAGFSGLLAKLVLTGEQHAVHLSTDGSAYTDVSPGAGAGTVVGSNAASLASASAGGVSAHAPTHESGGSDELDITTLGGFPGGSTVVLDGDGAFNPPTDAAAIHDNVAGEIAAVTEKVTPIAADVLLIEDSADSNNKKRVQVGNLPGGGGGGGSFNINELTTPPGDPDGGIVTVLASEGIKEIIPGPSTNLVRVPLSYYSVEVGNPSLVGLYAFNAGPNTIDAVCYININGDRFPIGDVTMGTGTRTVLQFSPPAITGGLFTCPHIAQNDSMEVEVTSGTGPIVVHAGYRDLPGGWLPFSGTPGQSDVLADILAGPGSGRRVLLSGAVLSIVARGLGPLIHNTDSNAVTASTLAINDGVDDFNMDFMAGGTCQANDGVRMFPVGSDTVIILRPGETLRAAVSNTFADSGAIIRGAYLDTPSTIST